MESIYIVILIVLFVLAITDLIVGVSNDAVNFLNSAIGSKAASFKVIMLIAGLGVLVGATFSNGMMEVARKGIFNPEMYFFEEIMIIFIAVMMTDVILLDLFNTFGLPTSTTVSIVFELLGAAVAIALLKILSINGDLHEIDHYINNAKALQIIIGILLSVFIAFTIGAIVQYITRIIFSFNYLKAYKYFGAIWGGFAITAITYFLLIKGAKGSSFINKETLTWIQQNKLLIIGGSFISWCIILQLAISIFKANILKFIVLVGTFALAMAFAGNDLVNFIGVPLAGLASFKNFIAEGSVQNLTMEALKQPVQTPTYLLLLAGIIMVATLWISSKARSVTQTTLDLSRQNEGDERFNSTYLAKMIVRTVLGLSRFFKFIIPNFIINKIEKRFDLSNTYNKGNADTSFDLIRASVNLVVASILIAFATSLTIPLSTTYVTFMVAMGASLSDRAWDRESAVYRVTGVITVIGGWFLTAIIAFTSAFLIAICINWGGLIALSILIIIAAFILIRSQLFYKGKERVKNKNKEMERESLAIDDDNIFKTSKDNINFSLTTIAKLYNATIYALIEEKRKKINKTKKQVNDFNSITQSYKNNIHRITKKLGEGSIETVHYYARVLDTLKKISNYLLYITIPIHKHIENHHKPLIDEQIKSLKHLEKNISKLFEEIIDFHHDEDIKKTDKIYNKSLKIQDEIAEMRKEQLVLIKHSNISIRNSMLFLDVLTETKNLINNITHLVELESNFTESIRKIKSKNKK